MADLSKSFLNEVTQEERAQKNSALKDLVFLGTASGVGAVYTYFKGKPLREARDAVQEYVESEEPVPINLYQAEQDAFTDCALPSMLTLVFLGASLLSTIKYSKARDALIDAERQVRELLSFTHKSDDNLSRSEPK